MVSYESIKVHAFTSKAFNYDVAFVTGGGALTFTGHHLQCTVKNVKLIVVVLKF